MWNRLFGRKKNAFSPADLHMPEVVEIPNIEEVFTNARNAAAREGIQAAAGQNVVVVTPGRTLMFQPCPSAGSMPAEQVANMERLISPKMKRKIAAIAYTEGATVNTLVANIPFFGLLLGMAYIGHAVWVFEGHSSALAAGCREADVLIVDSGMAPFLTQDWIAIASSGMKTTEIYLHDRATYSLRKAA